MEIDVIFTHLTAQKNPRTDARTAGAEAHQKSGRGWANKNKSVDPVQNGICSVHQRAAAGKVTRIEVNSHEIGLDTSFIN